MISEVRDKKMLSQEYSRMETLVIAQHQLLLLRGHLRGLVS